MRQASLKNSLLFAVAVLVISTGLIISQVATHRFSTSLLDRAGAQAVNIAHKLALDAADKILINDLVALQKILDDQMATNSAIAYLFVSRNGRILTHALSRVCPPT